MNKLNKCHLNPEQQKRNLYNEKCTEIKYMEFTLKINTYSPNTKTHTINRYAPDYS